ncbi:unnamed protein product [Pseudo-nitzschia multistriata]|uniref:Uncharacterized protein n=1 Tax=Pseudo-nitzschia multistriata TaxID=183589 RepID=A0A448Z1Y0_9STRA|nr:unnamed protein product [Pseudo-nitzschia multistriata]
MGKCMSKLASRSVSPCMITSASIRSASATSAILASVALIIHTYINKQWLIDYFDRAHRRRKLMRLCVNCVPGRMEFAAARELASTWAETGVIDPREERLLALLAGIPEDLRQTMMEVSIKCMPSKMDLADGVALVSALAAIGIINLRDNLRIDFEKHSKHTAPVWFYQMDDEGRVKRLRIGGSMIYFDGRNDEDNFDLPSEIAHLDQLEELSVVNCRSLPIDIQHLTNLEILVFLRCDFNQQPFWQHGRVDEYGLFGVELQHVTGIGIIECECFSSRPFFTWMTTKLPRLKNVQCGCLQNSEIDSFLGRLRTTNVRFREKLRYLTIDSSKLNDRQLETLLIDVLPSFSSVNYLNLYRNKIQSCQSVVNRIHKDDGIRFVPNSIVAASFRGNPIEETIRSDRREKSAMLSLLKTFSTIINLGKFHEGDYDPDVEYALRINHAGRSIIEGETDVRCLPLSIWPFLLEKAFRNSYWIYVKESELCLPERASSRKAKRSVTGYYKLNICIDLP